MASDEVTVIRVVRDSDMGAARRYGLSAAQREGLACLKCAGEDGATTRVGWVGGREVFVHSWCLESWRTG